MSVDVRDLPVAYQVQALRKWAEQTKKHKPCPGSAVKGKPAKYHNTPTERVTESGDVLRFDSRKEARRFDELAALERDGLIRDLRLQADFTLQEAYTDTRGRRVRAIRYRADFVYFAAGESLYGPNPCWELVVEDVKSRATRTKEYVMKRKLMKERFNIDIREV